MVIGGGGTSFPSNALFFDPPQCRVITAVGEPDPKSPRARPHRSTDTARACVGDRMTMPFIANACVRAWH
jgi:hypothetical protein